METVLLTIGSLIAGGLGGFFLHVVTMKISFKQKALDDKYKVYRGLIAHWLKLRNLIYSQVRVGADSAESYFVMLDTWYSDSQQLVGEAFLVADDINLANEIDEFNERFYWAEWGRLSDEEKDNLMDKIKVTGQQLVLKMREDIRRTSRLEMEDLRHIASGLRSQKRAEIAASLRPMDNEKSRNRLTS